jgi:hypothetical protein
MATNELSASKTILTRSEDWEKWYRELQANVSDEIWPHIKADGEVLPLIEAPKRPEPSDFERDIRTYAQLSAVNQKTYENARRFYEQDKKDYARQRDQLKEARSYIMSTISQSKRTTLDPDKSVHEWLKQLKKDTEPPKGYMIQQFKRRYQNTLRNFKSNKLSQWLDEWETIMVECIKHNLADIKDGNWLRDLADRIQPISDAFYLRLMENADDEAKSDPQEFRRVARELRERLDKPSKGGRTVRGGAFHTSFGPESSDEGSDAIHTTEAQHAQPPKYGKGRKRTGTRSQEDSTSKKATPECPACGMRGHSLSECWCIFEERLPEGRKAPSAVRIQKAKKKIEEDRQLREQIDELRRQMEQSKAK